MAEWLESEDSTVENAFHTMMTDGKPLVDNFLQAMADTGHLGNDTNSILLRLVGFAMHYYGQGDGEPIDRYRYAMGQLANNPLAQAMFKQTAEMTINKTAGV
tara:strand:+ start:1496 stop:1801 length:306 start_codon:yes stop_codon:yes gene_type:complete